MGITHLPATATAADVATVLAEDGAVVVDDHADLELLDRF
ncbi:MAG: hypothetical protein QOD30_1682, partial [Actinomycetota bacterium]|nr:hypothetical protein [Actinomycetota bacterium]